MRWRLVNWVRDRIAHSRRRRDRVSSLAAEIKAVSENAEVEGRVRRQREVENLAQRLFVAVVASGRIPQGVRLGDWCREKAREFIEARHRGESDGSD